MTSCGSGMQIPDEMRMKEKEEKKNPRRQSSELDLTVNAALRELRNLYTSKGGRKVIRSTGIYEA